jgi:hypothetical protein
MSQDSGQSPNRIENNQPKPKGGKRPGSGRKLGSATKKTREIADKAAAEGITPLEVMLQAMNRFLERAEELDKNDSELSEFDELGRTDKEKALSMYKEASFIAQSAAPYIHPKLSAIEHTGKDGGPIETNDLSKLTRDQVKSRISELLSKMTKENSDE